MRALMHMFSYALAMIAAVVSYVMTLDVMVALSVGLAAPMLHMIGFAMRHNTTKTLFPLLDR